MKSKTLSNFQMPFIGKWQMQQCISSKLCRFIRQYSNVSHTNLVRKVTIFIFYPLVQINMLFIQIANYLLYWQNLIPNDVVMNINLMMWNTTINLPLITTLSYFRDKIQTTGKLYISFPITTVKQSSWQLNLVQNYLYSYIKLVIWLFCQHVCYSYMPYCEAITSTSYATDMKQYSKYST